MGMLDDIAEGHLMVSWVRRMRSSYEGTKLFRQRRTSDNGEVDINLDPETDEIIESEVTDHMGAGNAFAVNLKNQSTLPGIGDPAQSTASHQPQVGSGGTIIRDDTTHAWLSPEFTGAHGSSAKGLEVTHTLAADPRGTVAIQHSTDQNGAAATLMALGEDTPATNTNGWQFKHPTASNPNLYRAFAQFVNGVNTETSVFFDADGDPSVLGYRLDRADESRIYENKTDHGLVTHTSDGIGDRVYLGSWQASALFTPFNGHLTEVYYRHGERLSVADFETLVDAMNAATPEPSSGEEDHGGKTTVGGALLVLLSRIAGLIDINDDQDIV